MNNSLENFTTLLPIKISKILKKINFNEKGIIFVVDKKNKLKGSISDGDLRRFILKGGKISSKVNFKSNLINKNPVFLNAKEGIEKILEILNSKIKNKEITCLPLIDSEGKIIDISTKEKIRKFPLASPTIGEQELSNLIDVVKTGWISSRGSYIASFEKKFSNYLGGGYSVAVSNGTNALQVGLMTLGIKKDDEVIVPCFTFGGSINAIINAGAKPVIADVSLKNWTLNLENIKKKITKKTKAIMPVHIYGQPYHIDEIKNFAKKKNLRIIDDCAEAIGGKYKKKIVGLENDCSCFSFFANKTITTGEGGMVVFKNKRHAEKAKILINQGLSSKKKYYHDYAGTNFRMTNMQASIGVAQLDRVGHFLDIRKKIFKNYDAEFGSKKYLTLLPKNNWSENSYWLYTLLINNLGERKRNQIILQLQKFGIECRPGFYSLNKMKPFKEFSNGDYKNSNYLSDNSISLPTTNLQKKDQNYIMKIFLEQCEKYIQ
mgnify:CR=1 FL=1